MVVAIQGELGSNSHVAALQAPLPHRAANGTPQLRPCRTSGELFLWLVAEDADAPPAAERCAVLPIENSLHGSVFEHFDLLLEHDAAIVGEMLLRVRHNVIAAPGVRLADLRQVRSHPVALSQCRRWLRAHAGMAAVPAYDTAGSVKQVMAEGLRDVGGIAPELAATVYGGEVLLRGIEDHEENYTRFLVLAPRSCAEPDEAADKVSLAYTLAHEPGTLLRVLAVLDGCGLNLTKIESRPVPGRPWEYVFFVDARFKDAGMLEEALAGLKGCTRSLQVLGRYQAAELPGVHRTGS